LFITYYDQIVMDMQGTNVNLGVQMQNHRATYSRIGMKLGDSDKAKEHLNKCLYYINIGSNDYINNYFLPQIYKSSTTYTLDQYSNILIDQLSQNIQVFTFFFYFFSLYSHKFTLLGICKYKYLLKIIISPILLK